MILLYHIDFGKINSNFHNIKALWTNGKTWYIMELIILGVFNLYQT